MRCAILALLLITPALVGCLGGSDDALDPSATDGGGEVPALPDGLEMEGAEVVSYNDRAVVWRWTGEVGSAVAGIPQDAAVSTSFDVPAQMPLAIGANLTWPADPVSDLIVRVIDAEGEVVCSNGPLSYAVFPSVQPAVACATRVDALTAPQEWRVEVDTQSSPEGGTSFTADLRLRAMPADHLHELAEIRPFETLADDGTALRGHVYLPDGDGPFGTVLELSGYWGTAAGYGPTDGQGDTRRERPTMSTWLAPFLEAGFAVALVNIRGTGESGGCQDATGPQDVADAGTVIQALSEEPWSNGHVGMVGHSWPAVSQYVAIASGAPALKAVVPSSGVADTWSEQTYHGAMRTDAPQGTAYEALGLPRESMPPSSRAGCPDDPISLANEVLLAADGDRSAFFEQRDHRAAINTSSVAFFIDHGMANGEILDLKDPEVWDRIPHGNKTMWLGQWTHNGFPARADYFPRLVAWFDHFLRDGPRPATGVVEFQDTAGTWHASAAWPPEGTQHRLLLSDGRLLPGHGVAADSEAVVVSSNLRAIPDACSDKALFVSPPLADDVVLAGVFKANLTVSSTLPDGNFVANLWHLDEPWACGQAPGAQGVSGVRYADPSRGLQKYEVGFSLSDLRHRGHLDVGSDFPVGARDVMRMTSESFATFVPAGERLVLAVGGGDPWLMEDPRKPVLTIHTGQDAEGELVLTVVEGELTFVEEGP